MSKQEQIWDDFFTKELSGEGFTIEKIDNEYLILPFQRMVLPSTRDPATGDLADGAVKTERDPVLTESVLS